MCIFGCLGVYSYIRCISNERIIQCLPRKISYLDFLLFAICLFFPLKLFFSIESISLSYIVESHLLAMWKTADEHFPVPPSFVLLLARTIIANTFSTGNMHCFTYFLY